MQIEYNIVKNPNWLGANQLAIYRRDRGFEFGATGKQIQVVVRAGVEPGTAGMRTRYADHSALVPGHDRLVVNDEGADGHRSWYNRRKTL